MHKIYVLLAPNFHIDVLPFNLCYFLECRFSTILLHSIHSIVYSSICTPAIIFRPAASECCTNDTDIIIIIRVGFFPSTSIHIPLCLVLLLHSLPLSLYLTLCSCNMRSTFFSGYRCGLAWCASSARERTRFVDAKKNKTTNHVCMLQHNVVVISIPIVWVVYAKVQN